MHPLPSLSIDCYIRSLRASQMKLSYRIYSKRSADGLYLAEVGFRPPFITEVGGGIYLNVAYEYCLPEEEGQLERRYSENHDNGSVEDLEEEKEESGMSVGDGGKDDENDYEIGAPDAVVTPERADNQTGKNQLMYTSFSRKSVVILAESEKPIDRPGENIRLIALNSRQLHPTSEKLEWPKFRVDWQKGIYPKYVKVPEDERRKRKVSSGFNLIYAEDPSGNKVKEWRNASQMTAFNLSFHLLSDAFEGIWRLAVNVFISSETLKGNVKNHILPRFLASIPVTNEENVDAEMTHFNVGATYTNGNSFQGHCDAQI
ncbi:unnamed protein product [Schistocephalus solidus]|uniref:2OG-FeII_Oxy_2 domain-containing protein n=1 Tax=Schistocephalus solidus TaxID=70667 RepID=A0A183SI84_SCHSO|nr:unnamed protein product [Schistocephalus solidus]